MEIPIIYRETRARVEFKGRMKMDEETGFVWFKYPGGEIPVVSEEDMRARLKKKGFLPSAIEGVMELFWKTVATETSVSSAEVFESVS